MAGFLLPDTIDSLDEDDINLIEEALIVLEQSNYLTLNKGQEMAIKQRLSKLYTKLRGE